MGELRDLHATRVTVREKYLDRFAECWSHGSWCWLMFILNVCNHVGFLGSSRLKYGRRLKWMKAFSDNADRFY